MKWRCSGGGLQAVPTNSRERQSEQLEHADAFDGCGPVRINIFLACTALLGGCSATETRSLDRFAKDGRIIALSGAGAGANNACFTCHGLDGRGDGAGSPRLAGLDAGYLERQLEAYADGRRYHQQMGWIAKQLDARERKAVSFHYAGLAYEAGHYRCDCALVRSITKAIPRADWSPVPPATASKGKALARPIRRWPVSRPLTSPNSSISGERPKGATTLAT